MHTGCSRDADHWIKPRSRRGYDDSLQNAAVGDRSTSFSRTYVVRRRRQPVAGTLTGREAVRVDSVSTTTPFTLGVASGDPTPDGIVLWTRLAPEPADPASLGRRDDSRRLARRDGQPHALRGGARRGTCAGRARPFGSRRGVRAAAWPGLLLSVRRAPRRESHRPLPHRAVRARARARDTVRVRHLSGLAERLLHRLSRHAAERSRSRAAPWRLHLRVRHRRDGTWDSRAGGIRAGVPGPAHLPAAAHAAQARPRSAGGPREVPVRRDLGRPRGRERLFGPCAGVRTAVAGVHRPPRGRVSGLLRAHADPRVGGAEAAPGSSDLPAPPLRQAGGVHDARRSAVSIRQPVRRRGVATLRCGARRRLHDARPPAGTVGGARLRALLGALEHRRAAAAHRAARARHDSAETGSGTTPGTAIRSPDSGS